MDGPRTRRLSTTLLVVSYNHSAFVTECLDSVLAQIRPFDRVIVADDASPDESQSVIRAYLARHPGFAEFRPNAVNRGLNRTLNGLLALVETDAFTVLAADDVLRPDRLEVQAELMERSGAVLVYSDARVIDARGDSLGVLSSQEYPWPPEPSRSEDTFALLLGGHWMPAASLLVRTDAVRDSGGYPDLLFEDYELLIRLAKRDRFAYSTQPLVDVRRLETSMMSKLSRDDPAYLRTIDHALSHYEGAEAPLQAKARATRWELAKRAIATTMPTPEVVRMVWSNRRGAGSRLAACAHLGRALVVRTAAAVRGRFRGRGDGVSTQGQ